MPEDPLYIRLLDRLGVNTTKLKWRLYQSEQRAKSLAHVGNRPGAFHWLKYRHKTCASCGALNDRDEKNCGKCGKRLPNVFMQRFGRALGATGISADGAHLSVLVLGLVLFVYAFQIAFSGVSLSSFIRPEGLGYYYLGSLDYFSSVSQGQYWRFLASGLVHGGLLHLGMNCYVLVQLLPMVESLVDRKRMIALITIWQFGSSAATISWYEFVQGESASVVGASGWLFGAMGYGIIVAHRGGDMQIRNSMIKWAAIVLVFGFMINWMNRSGGGIQISNAAHIAGLVFGLGTALLPDPQRDLRSKSQTVWNAAFVICCGMWLATFAFMALSVIQNFDLIARHF